MKTSFKWIIAGALLFALAPLRAEPADSLAALPADSLLARADRLYKQNDFTQAQSLYLSLEERGYRSAALFYNIGNTYFKVHDIKAAILYYERAHRLSPNDEDVNFNLGLCRSLTFDKIEAVPELFIITWGRNIRDLLSARGWSWLSIVCFVLTLVVGLAFLFVRRLSVKRAAFAAGVLLLFVSLGAFTLGWLQKNNVQRTDEAIVFAPSVTVKSSPDDSGTNLFVIHEGAKVFITDRIGEWCEIRIADGNKGWIRAKNMEEI
jgi:tetratricopeptide (TPR) repeat protein